MTSRTRGASLFRRLGRYPINPAMDPRENRLTEAFATALDRVDGLAQALASDWLGIEPPSEPVVVRTQRATAKGRFVDLELVFGPVTTPTYRVWVEIKHGADLHDEQLKNYMRDLGYEQQSTGSVVLLAPRMAMPDAPAEVPRITWQSVATRVLHHSRRPEVDAVSRWLLDELYGYLKEERLSDEAPLTPATVFALSAYPDAERSIARIVEIARSVVEAGWMSNRR